MIRIVQSVCTFVSTKNHIWKITRKNQPIKIAIFGLNSQRALARAKWRYLGFEQAWLNKVKFG